MLLGFCWLCRITFSKQQLPTWKNVAIITFERKSIDSQIKPDMNLDSEVLPPAYHGRCSNA